MFTVLLDEEGYENFSLRKVAKACNVSHTAPYRHFRNKDDLIIAIALEALHEFNQSLLEAVDKYPNELALSCWGLVHGMAILIAKKDFSYEGDYLELVRRVLWNGTFLN